MGPLSVGGLLFACLPREDLASYSSSAGGASGSPQGAAGAGSGGSDAGVSPGGGGEGNPPDLPLNTGGTGSEGDASVLPTDAGAELGDAAATDAGSLVADAGPFANQCAEAQGALVPDTNVCLFFAAQARVTWQAASLACQSRGAVLVSLKTLERDTFVGTLIDTDIWIGANDPGGVNAANNAFVWRDQTVVDVNMETWAEEEPDSVANQFCVAKSPPAMGGLWRDRPCDELKAYVCEQAL